MRGANRAGTGRAAATSEIAANGARAASASKKAHCNSPSIFVKKSPSLSPRCSVGKSKCVRFTKRRPFAQYSWTTILAKDDFRPASSIPLPRWSRDYRLLNTARTLRKEQPMSCTSDPPSGSLRERGTRAAQQRARGRAGLAFVALLGAGCTGTIGSLGPGAPPAQAGGGGVSGTGLGGGIAGSSQGSGGMSGTGQSGGMSGSGQVGGTSGTGGTAPPVVLSKGGVMLRLLTQAEYLTSVQSLLGTLTTQLTAPEDTSVAGFVSVGAGQMSVTDSGGDGVRNREPGGDCRGLRQCPALADARGLHAEGRSQRRLRYHLHQDLRAGRLPTRPRRRGSAAVARGGQERGDAGGHRRLRAADGDVRTAAIAELPLSGRDQQGRQQQRSPEVRRVVDGESPLLLADRRATQRGSAGCRRIGSARHRRRRPRRRCSLADECRSRRSHDCVLQRVRPSSASVGGVQEHDAVSDFQRSAQDLHAARPSAFPEERRAGTQRRCAVVL